MSMTDSTRNKLNSLQGYEKCPMCDGKGVRASGTGEMSVTLSGKVQKVIPAVPRLEPEKVQIAVRGADDLYKEIRIVNALKDENGQEVLLMPDAELEIVIKMRPASLRNTGIPQASSAESASHPSEILKSANDFKFT